MRRGPGRPGVPWWTQNRWVVHGLGPGNTIKPGGWVQGSTPPGIPPYRTQARTTAAPRMHHPED